MTQTPIKAAVCREFGAPLSLETLTLAPPGVREVRVKLAACAICHSDLTYMDGGWGGALPIVFGHEGAGVVVEAGADAGVAVGARVIVTLLRACGGCRFCVAGAPAQCEGDFDSAPKLHDATGKPVARGLKTGAFAEQVVVDRSQIAQLPDDPPFDEACLLACGVITGWGAVANTAAVPCGASVGVVGCGGVGLNCLQSANVAQAAPVAAIDLAREKLALAKNFGATHVFAADAPDLREQIFALTHGRGLDFVFMCAGSARAVELSASLVARTGSLVLVGMPPDNDDARINATTIANQQQRILGSKMGATQLPRDIPKLLRLHARGALQLRELIGRRFAFDAINDAVAASRQGGALRNVLLFE